MSISEDLVRWFYRSVFAGDVLSFQELLRQGLIQGLAWEAVAADNRMDSRFVRRMWTETRRLEQEAVLRGSFPAFEVVDGQAMLLKWHPLGLGGADPQGGLRAALRCRPRIVSELEALTWRQFEGACVFATRLMGAESIQLTPPGGEHGVDWYATVRLRGRFDPLGRGGRTLRIVGQAKHYGHRVDVAELRDFSQTISDIRHGSSWLYDEAPPWFRTADGPILGWVVGQTGFQSGAANLAREQGILCSDLLELSETFAFARLVCSRPIDDRALFVREQAILAVDEFAA